MRLAGVAVRPRIAVACLGGAAFFVRLLHVLSYEATPTNDMAVYVRMAVSSLSWKNFLGPDGFCWFPPGYALYLKPFFLAFDEPGALIAAKIGQAVLGAWTCVLIYRLGRRLHSRLAGLAAAAATAFFPHFILYTSAAMSETLFIALYYAALI